MIAENAGEEGAIVLGKINDSKDNNFGYNALTGDYGDLVEAVLQDPTKVVRTALTNAGSISSLMLTMEALVAEIPEEKKAPGRRRRTQRRHGGYVLSTSCHPERVSAKDMLLPVSLKKPRSGERSFFWVEHKLRDRQHRHPTQS